MLIIIYLNLNVLLTREVGWGFDIIFYVVFAPVAVLFGIWMYFQIIENEYNHRLEKIKEKE